MTTDPRTTEIAVIGMGCRFPGNADNPTAFWQMMLEQTDGIIDVPPERWDIRKYYAADKQKAGKTYARQGGFIQQRLDHFDPLPFQMSPKEAEVIDPMQRLLLEVAWETLDDAGVPHSVVKQACTGVFIGAFAIDNKAIQLDGDNLFETDSHTAFGVTMALLSNRISYAFDLKGPSFTVDTACSASMTALHLAVQSLRSGDCDMALVGGANAMMTPHYPVVMSKGQFLSHHSRCKAFDADAAGYVRAEGAGMVLLKPLWAAQRDGDQIHAVIVETGINQDGQTKGISLPNPDAQYQLLQQVYQRAGVTPAQLSYIEAHGTGTRAGDPLEINALGRALQGRPLDTPCWVGSVKTNIGHTEAASAMAGLIKACLVAKHKKIPANLHFHTPNPEIPFEQLPLKVVTELIELDPTKNHFIGVNSFGYGGSNGHVIVRSATDAESASRHNTCAVGNLTQLVPVSARSERALHASLHLLAQQLEQEPDTSLADLVYSLSERRTALSHRLCFNASTISELRHAIDQQLGTPQPAMISRGTMTRVAMVCTGMGPQWWAMGQELYQQQPVFRAALDAVDQQFQQIAGWSILSQMQADESSSRMHETQVAQPANFALQVALAALWAHYGVKPSVYIGHSVGEVASAYLSGALSLADACKVSFHRSRLQQQCANLAGGMLAVGLSEHDITPYLARYEGAEIAAINGPQALTLAGPSTVLQQLAAELAQQQHFCRTLQVEIAYHSSQMDGIQQQLLDALADLSPRPCTTPLISTVTGLAIDGRQLDAQYWWQNVRQAVLFAKGLTDVLAMQPDAIIELGPHPVLKNNIREVAEQQGVDVLQLASLQRKAPEQAFFLAQLASWYGHGGALTWSAFYGAAPQYIRLPAYPWQREHLWRESGRSVERRIGRPGAVYLNETLAGATTGWTGELNEYFMPYLPDHQVNHSVVFPGAGIIDAMFCAAAELSGASSLTIEQLHIHKMLQVEPHAVVKTELRYLADNQRFELSSKDAADKLSQWQLNASATLCQYAVPTPALDGRDCLSLQANPSQQQAFYRAASARGLHYGPAFQTLAAYQRQGDSLIARIETGAAALHDAGQYLLHPTMLDAAFQALLALLGDGPAFVPATCERLTLLQLPGELTFARCHLLSRDERAVVCQIELYDDAGQLCLLLEQLECRAIALATQEIDVQNPVNYQLQWVEQAATPSHLLASQAIIIDDGSELSFAIAAHLQQRGISVRSYPLANASHISAADTDLILDFAAYQWQLQANADTPEQLCERLTSAAMLSKSLVHHARTGLRYIRISQHAQQVLPDDRNDTQLPLGALAQAALAALSTAMINEYPQISCQNLDVCGLPRTQLQQLIDELHLNDQQSDIAWRGSQRYVRVLTSTEAEQSAWQQQAASTDSPVQFSQIHTGIAAWSALSAPPTQAFSHQVDVALATPNHQAGVADPLLAIVSPLTGHEHYLYSGPASLLQNRIHASPDQLLALPTNFPSSQLALVPPLASALYCLTLLTQPRAGQRLLLVNLPADFAAMLALVAQQVGLEWVVIADDLTTQPAAQSRYGYSDVSFYRPLQQQPADLIVAAAAPELRQKLLQLLGPQGCYIDVQSQPLQQAVSLAEKRYIQPNLQQLLQLPTHTGLLQASVLFLTTHQAALTPTPLYPAGLLADASQKTLAVNLKQQQLNLVAARATPWLVPHSSVLITGGTAGFGLALALQFARWGAHRLVLASRTGQLDHAQRTLLEQCGTIVETLAVDVSDSAQVLQAIDRANAANAPLSAVIHCAGVLADGYLRDLTAADFSKVLAPKVAGLLNLHQAVATLPAGQLQQFICCSSVSSLVGNPGQANYVLANCWQDEFCLWRRQRGLPALSVNWGALAQAGMVARDNAVRDILAGQGVHAISNHYAFLQLQQALDHNLSQVGIMDIEWPLWFNANQAARRAGRFRDIVRTFGQQQSAGRQFISQLLELPVAERKAQLQLALQHEVATLLRYQTEQVDVRTSLSLLGIDSLTTNVLSKQLLTRLGLSISSMTLLAGPTIEQLTNSQLAELAVQESLC